VGRRESRGSAEYRQPAFLALALLFALALAGATIARAAPWVEFLEMEHQVDFGRSVLFRLVAAADREPASVWLVYRLEGERALNRARAQFSGQGKISGNWLWELEPGLIRPGATIYYRWVVKDLDGNETESAENSLQYIDSRFEWQVIEEGLLRVYYYRNKDLAAAVLAEGAAALGRFREVIGVEAGQPISVYVYASERDMASAIPSRSQAFDARTVTLGMAMGGDTLVLLGKGREVLGTVAHELSHAVVHQATDNPFTELPRWLDEGLAMYAEGELPRDNANALSKAIQSGNLLTLRSMTSYPGDSRLVDLFYGQAYSLVAYMIETYGPDAMKSLLALIGEGVAPEEALMQAYGLTLDDLEREWLASASVDEGHMAATPEASGQLEGSSDGRGRISLPCAGSLLPMAGVFLLLGQRRWRKAA